MKTFNFSKILVLLATVLFVSSALTFSSCMKKKVWTEKDKDLWLANCNAKFTKDGVEPADLKRFCACALDKIEYDYTYQQLETETIPADKQRDYFNTCSFNY